MTGEPNAALIDALRECGLSIAVAESLTGGGVCASLVDVAGASDVLLGGICTYATSTKARLLNVSTDLLDTHGPVHPAVATAMAGGVATLFGADMGISTTGVAGPGPADGHPAGTVYIACTLHGHTIVVAQHFDGDRAQVRARTIHAALTLAHSLLPTHPAPTAS